MLSEVQNAAFVPTGVWWWRRWVFQTGAHRASDGWAPGLFAELTALQADGAIPLLRVGDERHWWFEHRFWCVPAHLDAQDVVALVREREEARRRELRRRRAARAHGRPAGRRPRRVQPVPTRAPGHHGPRERIPHDVQRAVFERDGGRCVSCAADRELQYDHLIPPEDGGASSAANLQVLCTPCAELKEAPARRTPSGRVALLHSSGA